MKDLPQLRQRIETVLRSHELLYMDLLKRMVRINSFTANHGGIETLARRTADAFEELGFDSESVPSRDPAYASHLVLTRRARSAEAPKIGLVSHLDTVFSPEEEKRNQFAWREDGDRLYGPGTIDIKGGTVIVYMMMDALRAVVPDLFDAVTWVFLLNSAEEQIAMDFGPLCLDRLEAERTLGCLVFEDGPWRGDDAWVVVARKGMAVFRITVSGRAAHSGSAHERGANALVQLAQLLCEIDSWTDYERHLTFNAGVASGGTVSNRVPHEAVAEVELRAFDPEVFGEGMRQMLALRETSTVASADGEFACSVGVDVLLERAPWPRNEASDGLLEIWQETAASMGMRVNAEERGGLSDGNQLWHRVPTLDGLGPSGANEHCSEHSEDGSKEQEYAERSSFIPRAVLNTLAVLRLAGGPAARYP